MEVLVGIRRLKSSFSIQPFCVLGPCKLVLRVRCRCHKYVEVQGNAAFANTRIILQGKKASKD